MASKAERTSPIARWKVAALLASLCLGCAGARAERPSASPASAAQQGDEGTQECARAQVAVQVLGSGGPIADDGRASSAYLVWIDGHARALVDAGSGLLPRFGAAGAHLEDLDVIALSHLHVDHSAGLAGLLKSGYFTERSRGLPLVGPSGNEGFPSVDAFLQRMLDPQEGAYRYLSGYLQPEGGLFRLEVKVVEPSPSDATVYANERLTLSAVHVHHAQVPALGMVMQVGDTRIAFTGDQSAEGQENFAELSRDANLMIAHHAIAEGDDSLRHLHMMPSEIGKLAQASHARHVVLSHNMRRALDALPQGKEAIRRSYDGPLDVAHDLQCFVLR